jgi:hypothetical protein
MSFTDREEQQLKKLVAEIDSVGSDAGFLSELIEDIRKNLVTMNELNTIVAQLRAEMAAQPGTGLKRGDTVKLV